MHCLPIFHKKDARLIWVIQTNTMDMILVDLDFKKVFLAVSNICCWYILELPHRVRGNSNVNLEISLLNRLPGSL